MGDPPRKDGDSDQPRQDAVSQFADSDLGYFFAEGPLADLDEDVPPPATGAGGWRRLSVNVANDIADAIETVSRRHGWTITGVIWRAVSILKFVDDEVTAGGKILVERDGTIREVKFLSVHPDKPD